MDYLDLTCRLLPPKRVTCKVFASTTAVLSHYDDVCKSYDIVPDLAGKLCRAELHGALKVRVFHPAYCG